jgi:hypothetical protein
MIRFPEEELGEAAHENAIKTINNFLVTVVS